MQEDTHTRDLTLNAKVGFPPRCSKFAYTGVKDKHLLNDSLPDGRQAYGHEGPSFDNMPKKNNYYSSTGI